MATKAETAESIKQKRESYEKKGQILLQLEVGCSLLFGFKDKKLCWKKDKQYFEVNKISIIPGFNFETLKFKVSYNPKDTNPELSESDLKNEAQYLIPKMNDAVSTLSGIFRELFFKVGYDKSAEYMAKVKRDGRWSRSYESNDGYDANESIKYDSNNIILEKYRSRPKQIGKIILNDGVYQIVASYNSVEDYYNLIDICDESDMNFYVKKSSKNVDQSMINDFDDKTDELIDKIANMETVPTIFGKIEKSKNEEIFKQNIANAVNGFVLQQTSDEDATVEQQNGEITSKTDDDKDLDYWDTDDIYGGSVIASPAIQSVVNRSVIRINVDNLRFEKILNQDDFIDLDGDSSKTIIITGREIGDTMRKTLEARESRIYINEQEARPGDVQEFLLNAMPNIYISNKKATKSTKTGIRLLADRIHNAFNPVSAENSKEAKKRENTELYRKIK